MPAPITSIHPVPLQTRHPEPPQNDARNVHFGAGLDERKEARTQARLRLFAEKLFVKAFERSLQIGESDSFIDEQAFDLMEHRRMRRIERVATKHAARDR